MADPMDPNFKLFTFLPVLTNAPFFFVYIISVFSMCEYTCFYKAFSILLNFLYFLSCVFAIFYQFLRDIIGSKGFHKLQFFLCCRSKCIGCCIFDVRFYQVSEFFSGLSRVAQIPIGVDLVHSFYGLYDKFLYDFDGLYRLYTLIQVFPSFHLV